MSRITGFSALIAILCLAACSTAAPPAAPATAGQTIAAPSQSLPTASAAAPADSTAPPTSGTPTPTTGAPSQGAPSPIAQPTDQAGASFDQPWATAALTDVATGETFTIADLAGGGKVVFVETMAIWCSNCRAQQVAAAAALEGLDPARVEWVVIDVETSESAQALARYKDQNGFPFRYVISDRSLSSALVGEFGDVVLNPPPVNVVVLGTDGRITHLLGHHSAADLVAIAIEHGA